MTTLAHDSLRSLGLTLLVVGCGTTGPTATRDNMAYLYGKGGEQLHLQARVYHHDEDRSTVYYKIPTRDLLYKGDGDGGPFRSAVRITYEAFPRWGSKELLDSASTLVQDRSLDTGEDKELIGSMDLRRNEHRTFVLKITAHDLHRESQSSVLLQVDRSEHALRQYFLPVDPENGAPLFGDHFTPGRPIKIRCEALAGATLNGMHAPPNDALPAPVFSNTPPTRPTVADSSFTISVSDDGTFTLTEPKPGVYHVHQDSLVAQGYSVFVLTESFPYVGTTADMLKPLRYIMSIQEFDRIAKNDQVRKAIETFWVDAAGDRERARDAIRIYYGRVENANRHFTSMVEGWRTDRGLVHIIFGTPTTIHKGENGETWIYGEENNLMSTTFNFVRRKGPFSENDLVLERDPMLKGAWYRNVESWRNGRIYQN